MGNKYKAIIKFFSNNNVVEVYGDDAGTITLEICEKYDYSDIKQLDIVRADILSDKNDVKRSR